MKSARILIAEIPKHAERIKNALAGNEIFMAETIREAETFVLEDQIDVFVIGLHFDEMRSLELVKFIRESKTHKGAAIVVVRFSNSEHERLMRDSFKTMKTINYVQEYVEFADDSDASVESLKSVVDAAISALSV